jgi:hypothetical protein
MKAFAGISQSVNFTLPFSDWHKRFLPSKHVLASINHHSPFVPSPRPLSPHCDPPHKTITFPDGLVFDNDELDPPTHQQRLDQMLLRVRFDSPSLWPEDVLYRLLELIEDRKSCTANRTLRS